MPPEDDGNRHSHSLRPSSMLAVIGKGGQSITYEHLAEPFGDRLINSEVVVESPRSNLDNADFRSSASQITFSIVSAAISLM